jgi:alpha-1,6-mannosyltransferase
VIGVLLKAMVVALFGGLLISTAIFSRASQLNYPGGYALHDLHHRPDFTPGTSVHISVAAAQTGISRFGQTHDSVVYSKVEQWTETVQPQHFEWLLTDAEGVGKYADTHDVVSETQVWTPLLSICDH